MKLFKKVLVFVLVLIGVMVIAILAMGKNYHFETSMIINAPIEKVYAHASSSKKFNEWNPWMDLDTNLNLNYKGTQGTVGDEYCWEGNDDVGQGCHVITNLVPNEKIATKMLFKKPFESEATSDLVFTKEGNNTKVTWSMDCEIDYPMNLMKLFMDKQMEASYGKGLKKLKALAEN